MATTTTNRVTRLEKRLDKLEQDLVEILDVLPNVLRRRREASAAKPGRRVAGKSRKEA